MKPPNPGGLIDDLELPDVQDPIASEVLKSAIHRHLDRAAIPSWPSHPDPTRMHSTVPEWTGAPGADPAISAIVALVLLSESLLEKPS